MLFRFDDYEELVPGVWIPFREEIALWYPAHNPPAGRYRYVLMETLVEKVKTDVDLTDTIGKLLPKEGEVINDNRFFMPVQYKYRSDRTLKDILKLVAAGLQKRTAKPGAIKRLTTPLDEMLGKPAPKLPVKGWIVAKQPELNGKPYLLHFWANWWEPCKNDFPLLKQLAADGSHIIGIHPDDTPADELRTRIRDEKLGYPTLPAP